MNSYLVDGNRQVQGLAPPLDKSTFLQRLRGTELYKEFESEDGGLKSKWRLLLEIQRERRRHDMTKQQLRDEANYCELVRELERLRRSASHIVGTGHDTALAMKVVMMMFSLESRVQHLEDSMAPLGLTSTSRSHEDRHSEGRPGGGSGNGLVRDHSMSPRNQDPPALLTAWQRLEDIEVKVLNLEDVIETAPGTFRRHGATISQERSVTDIPVEQGRRNGNQSINTCGNSDQFQDNDANLHEFQALDQAFEREFFSKPEKDPVATSPLSGRKSSDDFLLECWNEDVLQEKDCHPNSPVTTKQAATENLVKSNLQNECQQSSLGATCIRAADRSTQEFGADTSGKGLERFHVAQWRDSTKLATRPTLHLPPSFLAKTASYRVLTPSTDTTGSRPPSPTQANGARRRLMDDVNSKLASVSNVEATDDRPAQRVAGTTGLLLDNIRPSSILTDNYNVIPVKMINRLDCIAWELSEKRNPLFVSELEKSKVQHSRDQLHTKDAPFWVHSLRYEPSLVEVDKYRTVQIDHIPKECQVSDVLKEICFGSIESINLCEIGHLRGPNGSVPAPYKFARVVFLYEKRASNFQRWAHNKPLTIGGRQVRVYVEMEPTYPRHPEVQEILEHVSMRRIFSIVGLPDGRKAGLRGFIEQAGNFELVSLEEQPHPCYDKGNDDGACQTKMVMEFRSILHAWRVLRAIDAEYCMDARGFLVEADYCAKRPKEC